MANPYARTCVVFGAGLLGKSMGAAIGLDAALPLDGLLNAFFSEAEAKEREKARRFSESLAEELAIIGPKAEGTRNAVCLTIETAIQRFPISHRRLVELNLDPDAATAELMPHLAFSTASERTELEPWCKRLIRCFYDELPRHAHILAELLPDLWAVVLKRQHAIKDDTERLLSGQEKMLRQIELLEQDKSIPRLERQTTRLGLTNSAPTFKAGAELLIESYLGSEEKKVPFGGRAWELNTLNDWLDDESAPRRLLVTAPAARGKTALVLRWLDQLDTRWQCVLLPISVRFETNRELDFYQALAGALAAAFGESLPPSSTNPVDFYRGLATVWLRRTEELPRPLLLVVEGLDEAAGWQIPLPLLPHNPPPSLRILVSARLLLDDDGPAGWTGRLAWSEHGASPKVLEIQPLNGEDAIADVLTATGASAERLSKDRTLLSELYRLTLGDPLLLSFYVDDLTRSAKEPGAIDLVRLPALLPGLGGYFKRWLDDQYAQWEKSGVSIDHRMVNTILAILGCAFGPLRHGELAQLYRELAASELGPSSRSLYVLQRFIMGDGRDQGYVLCHPKLATYLRSEHFDDPTFLEQARDAFLDWGRTAVTRANAGETVPAETSPYLPKYFTAHLTEAEPKLADFMLLVENGWRRWRENVDEGTHGFATDVRMVLRRCIDAGAELYRLRCAIVLSSLLSIGQNIPAELLGAAFRHKLMSLEQVLHSARQQELPHRARSLCNIGKHLSGARRAEVFDEALDVVADINKPNSQEEILTLIVPELGRVT